MKKTNGVRGFFYLAVMLVSLAALGCGGKSGGSAGSAKDKVKYDNEKTFDGIKLLYSSEVTEDEAGTLGQCLVDAGFAGGTEKTIRLHKDGSYKVEMLQDETKEEDQEVSYLQFLASFLSGNVFDGAMVEVRLCDEEFKTVTASPRMAVKIFDTNTVLSYTSSVTKSEVDSLGEYLTDGAPDRQINYLFNKSSGVYEFGMVTNEDAAKDEKNKKGFKDWAAEISENVFDGAQVDFYMLDPYFTTLGVVEGEARVAESSSGGSEYDKLLDDYEKFVKDYVALAKKAADGDISAMTKALPLMQKAQDLSAKLASASGELSAAQAAKLAKISQEMAKAAGAF